MLTCTEYDIMITSVGHFDSGEIQFMTRGNLQLFYYYIEQCAKITNSPMDQLLRIYWWHGHTGSHQ